MKSRVGKIRENIQGQLGLVRKLLDDIESDCMGSQNDKKRKVVESKKDKEEFIFIGHDEAVEDHHIDSLLSGKAILAISDGDEVENSAIDCIQEWFKRRQLWHLVSGPKPKTITKVLCLGASIPVEYSWRFSLDRIAAENGDLSKSEPEEHEVQLDVETEMKTFVFPESKKDGVINEHQIQLFKDLVAQCKPKLEEECDVISQDLYCEDKSEWNWGDHDSMVRVPGSKSVLLHICIGTNHPLVKAMDQPKESSSRTTE